MMELVQKMLEIQRERIIKEHTVHIKYGDQVIAKCVVLPDDLKEKLELNQIFDNTFFTKRFEEAFKKDYEQGEIHHLTAEYAGESDGE